MSTQFHSAAVDAQQHPKRASKHRCSRPPSEPSQVRKLCSPAPRAHPNERAFLQSIALGLGHGPGRAWCRKRSPTMDLSCRTCTGGTSGGGHIEDVSLRELAQIRSLVRRAHAGPGLVAGPLCARAHAAHAPASKHRAELLRLPSRSWEQEACDSLPSRAGGAWEEGACNSLPSRAWEEAYDSLPPHGDDATPHRWGLQASKHWMLQASKSWWLRLCHETVPTIAPPSRPPNPRTRNGRDKR